MNSSNESKGLEASIPPPPNIPEPRPETPPPKIPNPEPQPRPKSEETATGDNVEPFKCNICGKTFDSKADLEKHIQTEHKTRKPLT